MSDVVGKLSSLAAEAQTVVSATQAIAKATDQASLLANMATVAVNDKTAVPTLVGALTTLDPTLVAPVQAKALLASKSPIGVALTGIVGYAATKYGLGLTPDMVNLVTGGLVLVSSYAMRYITSAPISGVFKAK